MTADHEASSVGHVRASRGPSVLVRLVAGLAWALIGAGILVALYLVYSLFFTNLQAGAEQSRLLEGWQERVGAPQIGSNDPRAVPAPEATPTSEVTAVPVEEASVPDDPVIAGADDRGELSPAPPSGEAVAVLWFERPGESPPVSDEPYVVVSGVTLADLAKGPGHYEETAGPGEEGNFAVAGHRTTNGAPFFHLDDLREGDEIHVMDTSGEEHVYAFREQRIVAPTNVSVLRPQPLGDTNPVITLTTCHPRFSNRQRLIVFGELVA